MQKRVREQLDTVFPIAKQKLQGKGREKAVFKYQSGVVSAQDSQPGCPRSEH
jgi:sulfur relay (sulfurtransferase) complex TusBCD TusD component (DsrE family)